MEFRLYVWEDVLVDWDSGIAVAAARSVDEARKTLLNHAEANFEDVDTFARDIAKEPTKVLDLPAAAYCWGSA